LDITLSFTVAEWTRVETAYTAQGLTDVEAELAGYLKGTVIKNVVHALEANAAYDTMKTTQNAAEAADTDFQ